MSEQGIDLLEVWYSFTLHGISEIIVLFVLHTLLLCISKPLILHKHSHTIYVHFVSDLFRPAYSKF
jgi:hypothetical protein